MTLLLASLSNLLPATLRRPPSPGGGCSVQGQEELGWPAFCLRDCVWSGAGPRWLRFTAVAPQDADFRWPAKVGLGIPAERLVQGCVWLLGSHVSVKANWN